MVIKQIFHYHRQTIINILYIQNSLNIQIEKTSIRYDLQISDAWSKYNRDVFE